jgi:hypothetical protein
MNSKKNARLLVGGLLILLVLLGIFVGWFNQATRLQAPGRNPLAGHLEVFVLLAGLALISSAGVLGLPALWKGRPKPFLYGIGLRLVVMGDLVGFLSGLADYIGIGVHHHLPYFGPWQTAGVFLGEALIAAGFLLMFPWKTAH